MVFNSKFTNYLYILYLYDQILTLNKIVNKSNT